MPYQDAPGQTFVEWQLIGEWWIGHTGIPHKPYTVKPSLLDEHQGEFLFGYAGHGVGYSPTEDIAKAWCEYHHVNRRWYEIEAVIT